MINEVDSLVLIQLVALATTMHSIAGKINDPVLLELAMPTCVCTHEPALSLLYNPWHNCSSFQLLFCYDSFVCSLLINLFWYSNQSTFRIRKEGNSPVSCVNTRSDYPRVVLLVSRYCTHVDGHVIMWCINHHSITCRCLLTTYKVV